MNQKRKERKKKNTTELSSFKDLKLLKEESYEELPRNSFGCLDNQRKMKKYEPIGIFNLFEEKIHENFKPVYKKKSLIDESFIVQSLCKHFVFSALLDDRHIQMNLLKQFEYCSIQESQYLFKEKDEASSFFILDKGIIQLEINQVPKKRMYPGEGFGELALLYSAPRSASIKALKSSFFWFIDRKTFKEFIKTIIQKQYQETRQFIEKNTFFTYFTKSQKDKIASVATIQKFQAGEQVFKEGQLASSMYILKSGKVERTIRGYTIGCLSKGDSFEEYAIINSRGLRRETVTVVEKTQLLAFGGKQIQEVLGKSLNLVLIRNSANKKLLQSKYFSFLCEELRDKIIDCFMVRKIEKDQVVIYEGMKKKSLLFFVIEGHYSISNSEKESVIFGEESVSFTGRQDEYDFSLQFKTAGKIAYLSLEKIQSILQCTFDSAKEKYKQYTQILENHRVKIQKTRKELEKCSIDSFKCLKKIGEGHFGEVYLAFQSQTNSFYALKSASFQVKGKKLFKYLENQKKVLEKLNSTFTVDYFCSFKSQKMFYFVMEFINGIELFTAIREIGLLSIEEARFYTANILHALEKFHENSIIYRDLKPQNIMVCHDGYLKLIDMGTCKIMQNEQQRTSTIIGTPCYMAPQVVSGKGYGFSVDLWSLGIIIFQLMSGYLPFGQDSEDPYHIFKQILSNPLTFPEYMNDDISQQFIILLLNKKPESRLMESFASLKNHPFFSGLDWVKMYVISAFTANEKRKSSLYDSKITFS